RTRNRRTARTPSSRSRSPTTCRTSWTDRCDRMRWSTVGRAAAGTAAASAVLGGLGSLGVATYFARKVLTPDGGGPTDHVLLDVDDEQVTISRTVESEVVGRYGLWNEDRTAHL